MLRFIQTKGRKMLSLGRNISYIFCRLASQFWKIRFCRDCHHLLASFKEIKLEQVSYVKKGIYVNFLTLPSLYVVIFPGFSNIGMITAYFLTQEGINE